VLREILEVDPTIRVVGEAGNGLEGVAKCVGSQPDVVLMDVQMPVADGFEAVARIMRERPTPVIVLSATVSPGEVGSAFQAVRAGAFEVLPKPDGPASLESYAPLAEALRSRVKLYARVGRRRGWGTVAEAGRDPAPLRVVGASRRVVALGASAGGPRTLLAILSALPTTFPCPILLVQHISAGFARGFTQWLSREVALPVRAVENPELLRPGTVYLAPDDRHLGVRRGVAMAVEGPPQHGCRPAVDVLFHALAEEYGSLAVAVLLTGMGKDGASGALAVRRAGGEVLVQDEATSVIFGMPKAAIELGAATQVVPAPDIPRLLVQAVGAPVGGGKDT
jgi:two-component system chemotaxis response regulator CheB